MNKTTVTETPARREARFAYQRRMANAGMTRVCVLVPEEDIAKVKKLAARLRKAKLKGA